MSNVGCNASAALKIKAIVENVLDSGDSNQFAHIIDFKSGLISSGTSTLSCDRGWGDKDRTIAKGQTITIDLYDFTGVDIGAGEGCDANGQPIVLEEIVLFAITNSGPGRLRIAPSGSDGWTAIGTEECGPAGAKFLFSPGEDGYAVGPLSCNVELTALHADCVYSAIVLGRSEDTSSESSGSGSESSGG